MPSPNLPIAKLPNLGPASAQMLAMVDIHQESDLRRIGAVQAFNLVREAGLQPSLNLLYAMEGALTGVKWNELSMDKRLELDTEVNFKRDLIELRQTGKARR